MALLSGLRACSPGGGNGPDDRKGPGDKTAHEQSEARDELGYEPEVRDVTPSEEEVDELSSKVLEWMALRGEVSEPGAAAGSCDVVDPDFTTYYVVNHPWSVHDVRKGSFAEAMANLRTELPKNGWRITEDGITNTKVGNPEITAVHPETHHTRSVEWREKRSGDLKSLILVDVDSRCYRAPKGTDLSGG
ncbi:hypothetical protein [Streptomyces sp. NPDC054784]